MNIQTVVAAVAAGALVLALWGFVMLLLARRRARQEQAIRQRLDPQRGQAAAPTAAAARARTLRLWHEGQETTTVVADEAIGSSPWDRFVTMCAEAGFRSPPEGLAMGVVLGTFLAAVALWVFTGRPIPAIFGLVGVPIGFWWFAGIRISRRTAVFERQLVDGLELSSRALKSGHPLLAAFQLIADEIPPPVGSIFSDICQQQALGVRMEDALRRSASRTKSEDMKLFAAAMAIHLRSGGNLADVMHGLAFVIRERMRLGRRFRTLIAQTQISKRILIGMPIIMFGVLNVIGPQYMQTMYSDFKGQVMLVMAATSMLIGWFVMNKMADLKV
jgi:tight adherence protein B